MFWGDLAVCGRPGFFFFTSPVSLKLFTHETDGGGKIMVALTITKINYLVVSLFCDVVLLILFVYVALTCLAALFVLFPA